MPRSGWEPWGLFRRPCEGRVQDNLRKWKTGGLRRVSDNQPFEDVLIVAEKPELGQSEEEARFIEHAHDDVFAVIWGMVETRRSTDFFLIFTCMRPSCGESHILEEFEHVIFVVLHELILARNDFRAVRNRINLPSRCQRAAMKAVRQPQSPATSNKY